MRNTDYFVGLMSGTSLDGVDAALVGFGDGASLLHHYYLPFAEPLRQKLLALNSPAANDLEQAFSAANELAAVYAQAVSSLLGEYGIDSGKIAAIGCHGQTLRHRPESGYTIQIGNAALLAELSGIDVVADFRSRDIAAGGQGAPLVPAFHAALFSSADVHRVIVNLGGVANLTDLPRDGAVSGFDCGPGCMLLDAWAKRHTGLSYDEDGKWSASGKFLPQLLAALLAHDYFYLPPPKSTGRELFRLEFLLEKLRGDENPADVQATLTRFTAQTVADAIGGHCRGAGEVYLCGGGARNGELRKAIAESLPHCKVMLTDELGVDADWVEAFAFAWLARQNLRREPANLPAVTGAKGKRILGALYPA